MLHYITGNKTKIDIAAKYLPTLGIDYTVMSIDLVEIQDDTTEAVAIAKAQEAFKQIQKPVIVNDHGWSITGLKGFPGAYMKYMNQWLTPEDFLNLTRDLTNREIILTEIICYQDQKQTKTFTRQHKGILLKEIAGELPPAMTITSLTGDGVSVAEKFLQKEASFDDLPIWKEFANWYKQI